jgi:hypothetical protein
VRSGLEGVVDVPPDVERSLADAQERNRMTHLMLCGALGGVGRRLDDEDVTWLVMKGPVVAALLYADVGERSYVDLDILVDRRDFARTINVLEDLGFEHRIHDWALAEQMLAGQVEMYRETVRVDLHWHLHYSRDDRRPYAFQIDAMLQRRRSVELSGVAAWTFDPVDTVIVLAFHAGRSGGHRLVWLKDLERAIATERPDFDEMVRRCDAYRCGPAVGVMLGRARALLGAEVPVWTIDALVPAPLRAAEAVIRGASYGIVLGQRPTALKWFTRSLRSTVGSTISEIPVRALRGLDRRLHVPPRNETDDPREKASYFRAVAASPEP